MECGCGRSPTGKCCGWHALSEEEYEQELMKLEAKARDDELNKNEDQALKRIRRTALALLSGYLTAVIPTIAQEQTAEELEAIASAMSALDEFMVAFNSRDMKAWAKTLNYPHVRFASGTVTVWQSAEEFERGATFERLPRTGWDHSSWVSRDVSLVSSGKVHFNTVFQRFNGENKVIGTYESLYIVTLVDGHWGTQARSSLAP